MKNIEYLEAFFKKHKLSGKIKLKFPSVVSDEYISDIVFENGDVVNINDIIFDIESDLPDDMVKQWLEEKKENDISLIDWIQNHPHYVPKDIDRSSVEEYQREMTDIVEDVKKNINAIFEFEIDEGDSDLDDESGDE